MTACGIWPATKCLVAVVADDDGCVVEKARKASYADEARWALLDYVEGHHGLDCAFVVSASLARTDPIARLAALRRAQVLLAPDRLIDDLRVLAYPPRASARQLALLLARLPLSVPFRSQLIAMRLQLPLFAER